MEGCTPVSLNSALVSMSSTLVCLNFTQVSLNNKPVFQLALNDGNGNMRFTPSLQSAFYPQSASYSKIGMHVNLLLTEW